MAKSTAAQLAEKYRRMGFDKSHVDDGTCRVQCSQCEALVIQGVPCHETGCPNQRRD
jgi:hypothetical protein